MRKAVAPSFSITLRASNARVAHAIAIGPENPMARLLIATIFARLPCLAQRLAIG